MHFQPTRQSKHNWTSRTRTEPELGQLAGPPAWAPPEARLQQTPLLLVPWRTSVRPSNTSDTLKGRRRISRLRHSISPRDLASIPGTELLGFSSPIRHTPAALPIAILQVPPGSCARTAAGQYLSLLLHACVASGRRSRPVTPSTPELPWSKPRL